MNKIKTVAIDKIKGNDNNPRFIKEKKFDALVKSIQEFPEMLDLRPIVVDEDMVILGGNMRFKACQAAGLKKVPIMIAEGLSEEQKNEFIIKDNVGFGQWDYDMLANNPEWNDIDFKDWGLDVFSPGTFDTGNFFAAGEDDPSITKVKKITLEFAEDEYNEVIAAFDARSGSREQIVWELLGLDNEER